MGQYQQWLLHRSIDRQLRQELEILEAELAQLESQLDAHFLEQCEREFPPLADNPILNALVYYAMNHSASSPAGVENGSYAETLQESHLITERTGESISPALPSWGGLPDFGPPGAQHTPPATSSMPHPEIELLPDDMLS